jgi:phosphoribosylamine--glycine ligase
LMRFLGIGDTCDLGALYLRLIADGHEVRVFISDKQCHGILAGMVERTDHWHDELSWIREAGQEGIILFENVAEDRGALQDTLRHDGFNVIGGSAYGDRLENDRGYAQRILDELGLPICRVWEFKDPLAADAFLTSCPGRYALKFNGPGFASADNYVGRLSDGADVRAVIAARFRQFEGKPASFILMEHVDGVEMGVGAYFDGHEFIRPACLDWEHKRFFPGDLGELTGEMGTVATFDRTERFFAATLARMEPLLRANLYCGYINLNTIVNEQGIWPLEFTCRFGYPGFAVLDPLQITSWPQLFRMMIRRSAKEFQVRPGFSVGVVLTTRPFPFTRRQIISEPVGLPVLFDGDLSAADKCQLHYGEVGLERGELVTSGLHGWTMVVTGVGGTIASAQDAAYRLADRVIIPNVRFRRDIGSKLIAEGFARIEHLNLLDEP